ncbi:MAG: DUF3073 family protein [Actinocatenispora sp.]
MGRRGKERAKQAKAAREIKYHSVVTDFNELERELGGSSHHETESDDDRAGSDEDRASSTGDSDHSYRVSS